MNNYVTKIANCGQHLVTATFRSTYSLSQVANWTTANHIFKDYYSQRLTLEPKQYQLFLYRLSDHQFRQADHRWISLLQNIEQLLPKFQLRSKIMMLKSLTRIGSKTQLFEKLYSSAMRQTDKMSFEEAGIVLWCLSKNEGWDRVEDIHLLYQRMAKIFEEFKQQGQSDQIRIIITNKQSSQFEKQSLQISQATICKILSAMAKLKITQKRLLKILKKNAIKDNIGVYSIDALCSILLTYEKLGMRNKRDTLLIYSEIRERYIELESVNAKTLENLMICVVNQSLREVSQHQTEQLQKTPQLKQEMQRQKEDMKRFVLWIFQTLLIRQQRLTKQSSAKLLYYCSKAHIFNQDLWTKALHFICQNIQDCKIVDLVMSLRAIVMLEREKRQLLDQQQQHISTRLWALYSSISDKSLDILAYLFQLKKINPPQKMAKILSSHNRRPPRPTISSQNK